MRLGFAVPWTALHAAVPMVCPLTERRLTRLTSLTVVSGASFGKWADPERGRFLAERRIRLTGSPAPSLRCIPCRAAIQHLDRGAVAETVPM